MHNDPQLNWLGANQRALLLEFELLKSSLAGDRETAATMHVAQPKSSVSTAMDQLTQAFRLTAFERGVVLLCAGVEMDPSLAMACGTALGVGRPANPTFGLALAVLHEPHWSALTPTGALRRWRLVELEPGTTLVSNPLRIDERILHFLAGLNVFDPRLAGILRQREPATELPQTHTTVANAIATILRSAGADTPVIQLWGDDPDGKEDVAAQVAAKLETPPACARVRRSPGLPRGC